MSRGMNADAVSRVLTGLEHAAIAVSGGVDSLTLATLAQQVLGAGAGMHHATSPAVPVAATMRVRALAAAQGWRLDVFDAGEFADPAYRANPVNRCFFCKTSLYGALAARSGHVILSGTNLDDLGDFRPGLAAARAHGVRHPFVEAGVGKAGVRALADTLGLGEIAALPASPCLSSRVETGLRIEAPVLAMVDAVETMLRAALRPQSVRCRVRASGVVVELDAASLAALDGARAAALGEAVAALARSAGVDMAAPGWTVRFAPYRMGSAFLRAEA